MSSFIAIPPYIEKAPFTSVKNAFVYVSILSLFPNIVNMSLQVSINNISFLCKLDLKYLNFSKESE